MKGIYLLLLLSSGELEKDKLFDNVYASLALIVWLYYKKKMPIVINFFLICLNNLPVLHFSISIRVRRISGVFISLPMCVVTIKDGIFLLKDIVIGLIM